MPKIYYRIVTLGTEDNSSFITLPPEDEKNPDIRPEKLTNTFGYTYFLNNFALVISPNEMDAAQIEYLTGFITDRHCKRLSASQGFVEVADKGVFNQCMLNLDVLFKKSNIAHSILSQLQGNAVLDFSLAMRLYKLYHVAKKITDNKTLSIYLKYINGHLYPQAYIDFCEQILGRNENSRLPTLLTTTEQVVAKLMSLPENYRYQFLNMVCLGDFKRFVTGEDIYSIISVLPAADQIAMNKELNSAQKMRLAEYAIDRPDYTKTAKLLYETLQVTPFAILKQGHRVFELHKLALDLKNNYLNLRGDDVRFLASTHGKDLEDFCKAFNKIYVKMSDEQLENPSQAESFAEAAVKEIINLIFATFNKQCSAKPTADEFIAYLSDDLRDHHFKRLFARGVHHIITNPVFLNDCSDLPKLADVTQIVKRIFCPATYEFTSLIDPRLNKLDSAQELIAVLEITSDQELLIKQLGANFAVIASKVGLLLDILAKVNTDLRFNIFMEWCDVNQHSVQPPLDEYNYVADDFVHDVFTPKQLRKLLDLFGADGIEPFCKKFLLSAHKLADASPRKEGEVVHLVEDQNNFDTCRALKRVLKKPEFQLANFIMGSVERYINSSSLRQGNLDKLEMLLAEVMYTLNQENMSALDRFKQMIFATEAYLLTDYNAWKKDIGFIGNVVAFFSPAPTEESGAALEESYNRYAARLNTHISNFNSSRLIANVLRVGYEIEFKDYIAIHDIKQRVLALVTKIDQTNFMIIEDADKNVSVKLFPRQPINGNRLEKLSP